MYMHVCSKLLSDYTMYIATVFVKDHPLIMCCSIGKDKKGGGGAESSGAPLVFVPNGKESRMKDEEKMKTLKWNFASPRAEFIDQLKEQMQPCVSAALYTQLFHDDFKQHIAVLGILTKVSNTVEPLIVDTYGQLKCPD